MNDANIAHGVSASDLDPAAYDYDLPPERIAERPWNPRDEARLLVLHRASSACRHARVLDLPGLLAPGDLIVVNETRVIPARVEGRWERTGRAREILLIREIAPRRWTAWVRGASRARPGDRIFFESGEASAVVVERRGEGIDLEFRGDVAELLASRGRMPLPPYIHRPADERDRLDYQTLFARIPGAVAAPTAGLHFTGRLLDRISEAGVDLARICLHVGPGTFRPIRAADLRAHAVEPEEYSVPEETAAQIRETRARGGRIVAVGTTTVRALESAAEAGEGSVQSGSATTGLTIVPSYRFRVVDALMTNFHLPRSSLLVLVSAFVGRQPVLDAYREAVMQGYRFYSYGDAMLILP